MSPKNNLSPGFVTIDEAVELIKSDTRQNPVVDMDYLILKKKWIETAHNFRIPKVRRLAPQDVYRTKRGKIVEYETIGEVNVYVAINFDKELLIKTINDKYRELVGHEYKEINTRAMSTVADDAQGRDAVRPRPNAKSIAQEGASIGGHGITTTNGENLTV